MVITLIGRDSLNKLVLPHEVVGNYWLYDKNEENHRKLVNIEAVNGNWKINSSSHSVIIHKKNIQIDKNQIKIVKKEENLQEVVLKKYGMYCIQLKGEGTPYLLYCSPMYEENYLHLRMKGEFEIRIGSDKRKSHLFLNHILISPLHAKLYRQNHKWVIQNYNRNYNTYINGIPVSEQTKTLQNGDVIFILGVKIIVMGREIFVSNPSRKVKYNTKFFDLINTNPKIINREDEEVLSDEKEARYFLRPPRMLDLLEEKEIRIETPRKEKKEKGLPMILVMGTMFSFAAMTVLSIFQTIDGFINGELTRKNALFSLIMSSTMLLSSLLLPLISQQYMKNQKEKNIKERDKKYKEYIQNKLKMIEEDLQVNQKIICDTYPSNQECLDIILNKDARLWERKATDQDFLTVRLGIGDVLSNLKIVADKDEESFEENEQDEFDELIKQCVERAKTLKDAPVLLSFVNKRISAIIAKDENDKFKLIQNIVLQLVTFHSYDELKLVFLLKDNGSRGWDFTKMLPHTWNGAKNLRFFAYDYTKIKEVSQFLSGELKKRITDGHDLEEDNQETKIPHYLIIIEDYKMVENLNVIQEILNAKEDIGFSLLIITNQINHLPNQCKTFIALDLGKGVLFGAQNATENQIEFKLEENSNLHFDNISQVLFNIPIKYTEEKEMLLPSSYNFLEMFNVGCIEQLNIFDRWKKNDSTVSLAAPLGVDGYGNLVELDIHEKFHGPHGLIAGSTGSRKK